MRIIDKAQTADCKLVPRSRVRGKEFGVWPREEPIRKGRKEGGFITRKPGGHCWGH